MRVLWFSLLAMLFFWQQIPPPKLAPVEYLKTPEAQAVFTQVNAQRESRGLAALALSAPLCQVAQEKAEDMVREGYFSHQSPQLDPVPTLLMKKDIFFYRLGGENLARGRAEVNVTVAAWMDSEGHRKNILNRVYTQTGIGVVQTEDKNLYYVQIFIG